jgi:hypothetical protein
MITIWRRHTDTCRHREKGRDYLKCNCPLWADGYVDGKRTLRKSLGTRDMARARKKVIALESDDSTPHKPIADAVKAFLDHCKSNGRQESTFKRYRNPLTKLTEFCEGEQLDSLKDLEEAGVEKLDQFRAERGIAQVTAN